MNTIETIQNNNSVENVTENFEEHVGEHTHDPNGSVHQDSEDEDEAPSPSIEEGFFGSGSGEVEDPTQMPQNNGDRDGNESDTGSDVMPSDGENNLPLELYLKEKK